MVTHLSRCFTEKTCAYVKPARHRRACPVKIVWRLQRIWQPLAAPAAWRPFPSASCRGISATWKTMCSSGSATLSSLLQSIPVSSPSQGAMSFSLNRILEYVSSLTRDSVIYVAACALYQPLQYCASYGNASAPGLWHKMQESLVHVSFKRLAFESKFLPVTN